MTGKITTIFTNLDLHQAKTHYIIHLVGTTTIKCLQDRAFEPLCHYDRRTLEESITFFHELHVN